MWISDTSIRRPVTTITVMAALVIFGWLAFRGMGIDAFPNVELPTVTVRTILVGASPEVVDQDVTDPLEEQIKAIAGIKTLTSQSFEGLSFITVEFELDKDIDVAAAEVRAKVNLAREFLPDDVKEPIVDKFNMANFPILWLSVGGTADYGTLVFFSDKVAKERLQSIPGVANVWLGGLRDREIRIWLDPPKLEARSLTAQDVIQAIRTKHVELPGGRIETAERELTVKVEGEYGSVEELRRLVVSERGGVVTRLEDVGRVDDGFKDLRSIAYFNGRPTIGLGIRKQSGANTVAVAEAVKAKMPELRQLLPAGVHLDMAYDSSTFIKGSMEGVQHDILFGILLTALIMYLFLRESRTTVISVVSIPISLVAAFTVMKALDFTVNNMTMLAMSLAVGLVIDDAIVVLENIFRHVEEGEEAREAARRGTAEVGFAVLAATSSIAAVFIPVAFMEGLIGRFFYQFGLTVAVTIVASALVALTLTPYMSSRMLRVGATHTRFYRTLERFFEGLESRYRRLLEWAVVHRWTTVALAVVALAGGLVLATQVKGEFTTPADQSSFFMTFELPTGTSVDQTNLRLKELEKTLFALPEIESGFTAVGLNDSGEVNQGMMFINLVPKAEREKSQFVVMDELRAAFAKFPDMISQFQTFDQFGGAGRNTAIALVLQGPTTRELAAVAEKIKDDLRRVGGLVDIDSDLRVTKPDVKVTVNRGLADDLGVDVQAISGEIYAMFGGIEAAKFKEGGYRYDIRVRALPQYRKRAEDLQLLSVRARDGSLIKAPNLIAVEEGVGPNAINRFDRRRAVTLYANVTGISENEGLDRVRAAVDRHLPQDGRWSTRLTGRSQTAAESSAALVTALVLALLIIYMVLAVQFESFVHPFTVMLSLPFTMVGVFGALLLTGKTLNIFSFIGIIMLMGIVTKNAILLIDFANQQREKGVDKVRAMLIAGPIRLRPILMTAASSFIGIAPVAFALSEGGETRAPLAVVVMGGVLTSTLLTLIVIPVIYLMFDDAAAWFARIFGRSSKDAPAMKQTVLPLLLIAGLTVTGAACTAEKADPPPSTPKSEALKAQTVETAAVVLRDLSPLVETTGTLVPKRHAELRALSEGRIDELPVDIGRRVAAGQLLMQVRTVEYRNTLEQAEAALARATAALADREREKRRMEGLFKEGSATEQMRDQAATAHEEAVASLKEAQAHVSRARQSLEDATLRAPYDGVITGRSRQRGEYVARGDGVVEIMDLSSLEAEMEVPEPYAGRIPLGLAVSVKTRSGADSVPGKVVAVNPKVDLVTRTFRVKIEVDNREGKLQANLFCTATLELPAVADVPAVPIEALQRDEGRSFVWIIDGGKAVRRDVREIGRDDGFVFIEAGLTGGEQVVVAGGGGLHDGAEVEVKAGV
jgi:HAE1 family hydrophobic/amphiphilic exporter-1